MSSRYFGFTLCSYLLYLFLPRMELFLLISFMLEPSSIISRSFTLSTRLSLHILARSLSISSLSVALIIFSVYLIINSLKHVINSYYIVDIQALIIVYIS